MKKAIAIFCFAFGASALFFFLMNIVIAGAVFIVHGSESVWQEWLSIAATVVFVVAISQRYFRRYILAAFFIFLTLTAVFTGSLIISKHFYDISYDGQTYQQEGVIQLATGWNPIYQNLDPAVIGGDQKWINYYPKGIWIVESYFYLLTHALQAAKGLNIILIIVTGALVYAALLDADLLGPWSATLLALLIVCNPVTIVQSLNFYVDGDLYLFFIAIIAIAFSLYQKKRPFTLLAFFSAVALLINIKFTGLVDAGILLIILFVVFIRQADTTLFSRWFTISVSAVAIAVLFIGASPYITNLIRYQAPFYPLYGKGSEDLKPYNVPGDYIDKNSVEIFFLSFFARSGQERGVGTTATYKIPFTFNNTELTTFRYPDPEEGGFGPLFGGIIIFAFLAWILCWFLERKRPGQRIVFWNAGLAILFLIIICVINPISSLARYVPQGYLLAVIPALAFLILRKPIPVACGCILIALLFFNNYLIANSYISYNFQTSDEITTTLKELATQSKTTPILIHFNEFKSNRIMFEEAGINYISVPDVADCPNAHAFLPENTTQLCES